MLHVCFGIRTTVLTSGGIARILISAIYKFRDILINGAGGTWANVDAMNAIRK